MIIIIYSKNFFQDNAVLDADRIYNHDESGFPTNQTNWKFITVKGERAFKLSFGARRENITSNGIALDPLIIFKGKNLMELWFGTNALPNTCYGKSDKGWMDSRGICQMLWKILQGCQGMTVAINLWQVHDSCNYTSNHIGNERKCYSD